MEQKKEVIIYAVTAIAMSIMISAAIIAGFCYLGNRLEQKLSETGFFISVDIDQLKDYLQEQ